MKTVNQNLQTEAVAHSLFVSRYASGEAARMVRFLDEMDGELEARLYVAVNRLPEGDFRLTHLQSNMKSLQKLTEDLYAKAFGAFGDDLLKATEYELDYNHRLFGKYLPDQILQDFPLAAVSPEQVYAAATARPFQGKLLSEWAEDLSDDRLARIERAVQAGYIAGETTDQIVRRVMGTKANGYADGVIEANRRNVKAVVRTAISHFAATARKKFAQANADLLTSLKWLSTLDGRTTPACQIRDGKSYTLDGEPIGHEIPYGDGPGRLHFGCRSTELLVTKSWKDLGYNIGELKPATRASMDGQVPADTNYKEWLMAQPIARQIQVLGKTRVNAIKKGDLTFDQLYNERGMFLTLDELKKIDEHM
ncbi:hypothetical protein vBSlqSZDD2_13 [Serratia phage vB_SlqS_ZDD2]|nr:hypothetical protein vBSlqSZDD2_13 [Serratia phage vB_SlqS_ZDD2]